ncbi:hypothetical protein Nocox_33375 [Nonomuraea coxensis DSM 45129]|uniref:Thioesterase domain-containing protein n=1 Tax=Nonomuraea coxensis DSM 45129 TaxID=1122611 RepID=A0ABX8U904_9ACTN|nr:hypothetical protein [Nonomuraea coxensis]QYC44245.1 hypothetical protein Nocox_33375 [Nonomuraea coxensis DSM 45129]
MLEKVTGGEVPPVVLVDFAMFSTADTLTGLIGVPESGRAVYRVEAVQDLEAHGHLSVKRLADLLAREIEAELAGPPAAVLGWCSAATLTMEIAQRVGDAEVVLVEPTWPTTEEIGQELAHLRTTLGAGPGGAPAEITRDSVLAVLRADLVTKLTADGIPESELETCVDLLSGRYRAWFDFLFATAEAATPAPARPVRIVTSRDSDRGPAPGWTPAEWEPVRVDVPGGEFLRSPAARERILGLAGRRHG